MTDQHRAHVLHFGTIALLALMFFILPAYHVGNLARIMVLASYAIGYNFLFGYTGCLALVMPCFLQRACMVWVLP